MEVEMSQLVTDSPWAHVISLLSDINRSSRGEGHDRAAPKADQRKTSRRWPEDAKMEAMRDAFARSSSPEEQKKIAADIQKEAYDQVIYIPLGQFTQPSAWRKSLTGVLDGPATPVFWNIDKSE